MRNVPVTRTSLVLFGLVALVLGGVLVITTSCGSGSTPKPTPTATNQQTATPTPRAAQTLTNKNASDLTLKIADFPQGWQIADEGDKDEGYEVRVVKLNSVSPQILDKVVVSWVKVFADTTGTSTAYQEERQSKAGTFRLDNPGIGDESYVYSGNGTFEVLSRHANVLARTSMYNQYGGSLDEVKQWAKKVDSKVR
jgi:hypothetical protein